MKERETLHQFPCLYRLKVVGNNTLRFQAVVSGIIEKHLAEGNEPAYAARLSSGDKYMSLTATFSVDNQGQLDAIYRDLNAHELVLMTL